MRKEEEIKEGKQEITDDKPLLMNFSDEILVKIFSYLDLLPTLYRISATNSRFLQMAADAARPKIRQYAIDLIQSMKVERLIPAPNLAEPNEAYMQLKKIQNTHFYKYALIQNSNDNDNTHTLDENTINTLLEEKENDQKKQIKWATWRENQYFIFGSAFFYTIFISYAMLFTIIVTLLKMTSPEKEILTLGSMCGAPSCNDNHCADEGAQEIETLIIILVVAITLPIFSAAISLLNTALERKLALTALDRKSALSNTLTKLAYLRLPILSALAGCGLYYTFTTTSSVDVSKCISFTDDSSQCNPAKLDNDCIYQTILLYILFKAPFFAASISSGLMSLIFMIVKLGPFALRAENAVTEWCHSKFFSTPASAPPSNNNSDDNFESQPLLITTDNQSDDDNIELQNFGLPG